MAKKNSLFARVMAGVLAALMVAGACFVTIQFLFA